MTVSPTSSSPSGVDTSQFDAENAQLQASQAAFAAENAKTSEIQGEGQVANKIAETNPDS
jgi:hypothetical protein